MCKKQEFTFASSNGKTDIGATMWAPEGEARGVMQISHGICEHIDRYDDFARFMAKAGFVVVGNDHLGHGRSFQEPGDRGFFCDSDGWMCVVDDIHTLYTLTHNQYPHLPYFLLGHSMGSFLARTYLIRYPRGLSGALLSGTGQQAPALVNFGMAYTSKLMKKHGGHYRSKKVTALCFGSYNNHFMPVRTMSDWLTRDTKLLDEHLADQRCSFTPTLQMYYDMFWGIKFMSSPRNQQKMNLSLPVYFFSGDMDPVGEEGVGVCRSASGFLKAGCRDVTVKLYDGARHEILNETNRGQVYLDLLKWVETKMD